MTPPTANFVYYNHETRTIDLSAYFANIGTGDYAKATGNCPLSYVLDTANPAPSYVTIPSSTVATMNVSPTISDNTFGIFTFIVKAYYTSY